jgi:hypothetical protein
MFERPSSEEMALLEPVLATALGRIDRGLIFQRAPELPTLPPQPSQISVVETSQTPPAPIQAFP